MPRSRTSGRFNSRAFRSQRATSTLAMPIAAGPKVSEVASQPFERINSSGTCCDATVSAARLVEHREKRKQAAFHRRQVPERRNRTDWMIMREALKVLYLRIDVAARRQIILV